MNARQIDQILKVACSAALESGKLLKKNAGRIADKHIEKKTGANNFVTAIDRKSENTILKIVRKNFPDHAILAEESGASNSGEITWMIDPIDGTSNFIHGFPLYSVSIGVAHKGRVIAGVVYDAGNDDLFSAADKRGAFLNGRRLRVSPTKALGDSILVTGIPFRGLKRFNEYMKSFENLSLGSGGMRRGGSAALDLAYVAAGRLDAYWEIGLQPWDIAAGTILVREAGGNVTDLWGKGSFLDTGDILASNAHIHGQILKHTKKIPTRQ